jgi:AAA family ATP:ADP antiporter
VLDKTETPQGLARWYQIGPAERRTLVLAFAYFFFLLASYCVLRPVRDEMAVRSGVRSIPWLFTATFVVSLAIAPIYGVLVAKLRRGVFIPLVYGFLLLNILAFWALLSGGIALDAAAKAFFVWLSVFNVFAVSVFWSFMADLFEMEQAKRLYPLIAAGGSLGGLAGSVTVTGLATIVGPANLLLIAAGLLLAALALAVRLDHVAREVGASTKAPRTRREGTGGGWLAGLTEIVRSPYLASIAVWVFGCRLPDRVRDFVRRADPGRARRLPGGAAHRAVRPVQPGPRGPVHGARPGGDLQGQERHRQRRLPRLGCRLGLAVQRPA